MYVVNLLNQYLLVGSGTVFCFWHTKIPVSLQLLVSLSELEEHGNLITVFFFVQRGLFLSGQARAGEDTTSLPMLFG